MKHLQPSNFGVRTTFDSCVASITPGPLKDRLRKVAGLIEAAEAEYAKKAAQTAWFSISKQPNVGGHVSVEEMKRLYKGTFARSVRTRHIYDAIKKLPPNDICPLCSQRTVFSLDHYLAQTHHPALVVTPMNLVPACAECNKLKLDAQPTTAAEQTFHPYFDDFDDERWLFATVEQTIPARVVFRVAPPSIWPKLRKERVIKHFSTFKLGSLYASHSGVELTNIRNFLHGLAKNGTPKTVGDFLRELAKSAEQSHKNSWQTATYYAFSESDWFCGGGFAEI